jgi:hypothetical protein
MKGFMTAALLSACLMGCSEDKQLLIYSGDYGANRIEVYSIASGSSTKATKTVIRNNNDRDSVVIYCDEEARKSSNLKTMPLGYSENDYVQAAEQNKHFEYAKSYMINQYGNKILFDSQITGKIGKEAHDKLVSIYTPKLEEIMEDIITKEKLRKW